MKKLTLMLLAIILLLPNLTMAQDSRYFEMRTYTANEGKRPDLIKRFQDHTLKLFEKNGIENMLKSMLNDNDIVVEALNG